MQRLTHRKESKMSAIDLNQITQRSHATTGEAEATESLLIEQTEPAPELLLMLDIESLDLGPRPAITQVALLGYDLNEDELLEDRYSQYLPVDPQLALNPPRTITAKTIAWWMKQSDEARERFELNTGDDPEDLAAAMRGLIAAFNRMTLNGTLNYELCAKGPQFDVVAIESLLAELGLAAPWDYRRVTDLRSDLRRARINPRNVPKPDGCVPHVAFWDARWQIEQYLACKRIRSRG